MTIQFQNSTEHEEHETSLRFRCLLQEVTAPLVYLVHGRAGTAELMSMFRSYIPPSFSLICPQAFLADEKGGFSWWPVASHAEVAPSAEAGALRLGGFIQKVENLYSLKPAFRLALGFSQGGAVLSILAQQDPILFRGVAMLASFVVPQNAKTEQLRLTNNPPEFFMAHGSNDAVVPIERAKRGVEFLQQLSWPVLMVEDPVEHKVGSNGMRELKAWLGKFAGDYIA